MFRSLSGCGGGSGGRNVCLRGRGSDAFFDIREGDGWVGVGFGVI